LKSSTPKNQQISGSIPNYRSPNQIPQNFNGTQRLTNHVKNMTQVINIKDHLPADLRAAGNQGSMHAQRMYMAQQKLTKQLKLNTNNESFMRYGNTQKIQNLSAFNNNMMHNPGSITTTAANTQQKAQGGNIFNFNQQQHPQNVSSYTVGMTEL
jgi:hypothetical protein